MVFMSTEIMSFLSGVHKAYIFLNLDELDNARGLSSVGATL